MKNIFKSNKLPSKDYLYLRDIIQKWLEREDSKIIISDSDIDCHITNEDKTISIYLSDRYVQISNHRFFVQKILELENIDKLKSMVRQRVKKDISNFKTEVRNNEEVMLREIFNFE